MKQSKRNLANAIARAEKRAKGPPPVSAYAAKKAARVSELNRKQGGAE